MKSINFHRGKQQYRNFSSEQKKPSEPQNTIQQSESKNTDNTVQEVKKKKHLPTMYRPPITFLKPPTYKTHIHRERNYQIVSQNDAGYLPSGTPFLDVEKQYRQNVKEYRQKKWETAEKERADKEEERREFQDAWGHQKQKEYELRRRKFEERERALHNSRIEFLDALTQGSELWAQTPEELTWSRFAFRSNLNLKATKMSHWIDHALWPVVALDLQFYDRPLQHKMK